MTTGEPVPGLTREVTEIAIGCPPSQGLVPAQGLLIHTSGFRQLHERPRGSQIGRNGGVVDPQFSRIESRGDRARKAGHEVEDMYPGRRTEIRAMGEPRSGATQASPSSSPMYRRAAASYSGATSSSISTWARPRINSAL